MFDFDTHCSIITIFFYSGLTAIVFVTICTATMVNPEIYSEMFVVPLGTLFAFLSIRANLPGAPDGFSKIHVNFSNTSLKLDINTILYPPPVFHMESMWIPCSFQVNSIFIPSGFHIHSME